MRAARACKEALSGSEVAELRAGLSTRAMSTAVIRMAGIIMAITRC